MPPTIKSKLTTLIIPTIRPKDHDHKHDSRDHADMTHEILQAVDTGIDVGGFSVAHTIEQNITTLLQRSEDLPRPRTLRFTNLKFQTRNEKRIVEPTTADRRDRSAVGSEQDFL